MAAFGLITGIAHYLGLCVQLNGAWGTAAPGGADNHISGNALFTEVPHDITTRSGEDVEMACSFRGAGSPSYSLEIQWWYIKNPRKWQDREPAWTTNQVLPLEDRAKDATKISVVKVAGGNISHKLRLSSVKPSDEGMYECHVIDFSATEAQHHRVRARLRVEAARSRGHGSEDVQLERSGPRGSQLHPHSVEQTEGRELKRRSVDGASDCNESCLL